MFEASPPRPRLRTTVILLLIAGLAGLSTLPHAQTAAAAAPLFSDGFESGTTAAWTKATGVVVQTQTVHAGTWAASMTSTGGGTGTSAVASLPAGHAELFLKAWVDLKSSNLQTALLRMRAAGGADIASAGVLASGRLYAQSGGGAIVPSQIPMPKGSWHELQLHVALGSAGGDGRIDVWLDGVPVTALSLNVPVGTAPIARVQIGDGGASRNYAAVFDDVAADASYVDDLPPAVPLGIRATAQSSSSIEVSWNASQDVGTVGYTLYRLDGSTWTNLGSLSARRYVDAGLTASTLYTYAVDAVDAAGVHSVRSSPVAGMTRPSGAVPVTHVVIIDQENHSFDNVLGKFCAEVASGQITGHQPCDGATTATLSNGSVVNLTQATDLVSGVDHSVGGQQTAIDGGAMDGFDQIDGCRKPAGYACLSQFDPSQIPNLAALAQRYALSDRTFEMYRSPSWAGHMVLASATQDGFQGDIPTKSTYTNQIGPGWGCDSFRDAQWWNGSSYVLVPSCVPDISGAGPYRSSPVPYVPTIFDRMEGADLSWKIYGGSGPTGGNSSGSGYGWSICPTFYECLGSSQKANWGPAADVIADANVGALPNFSIVAPMAVNSQHNNYSMTPGDNWIGQILAAIQAGPDWASTAVFITYDDCGCFYDHVPPPSAQAGVRVPLVIVSPYAKRGMTDSHVATFGSLLAYAEHLYGLAPLATADAGAYDYRSSFNYAAPVKADPVIMVRRTIPAAERAWIRAHPVIDDPT